MNATRVLMAATLILAGTLISCLPVPLGDPEKSVADKKFFGAWEWREEETVNIAFIRPWDQRTYVIDTIAYSVADGKVIPKARKVYKGWLTDVKGQAFLSMRPIEWLHTLPGEKAGPYYLVMKVEIEADRLVATPLDNNFEKFKDVGTATALEKVVAENIKDVGMFGQPVKTTRVPENRMGEFETIMKAFEDFK